MLQDLRDRHRSEGTKEYFHSATPHTGEDGYDTIEWIAAQPWSNGRTGMVGSSYAVHHAGPHRARGAAAPDRDLARRRADERCTTTRRARAARCSCTCSGRSTSTPPTRRTCRATRRKQEDVWDDLRNLRQLIWGWPWHKGELALRHVPALDETLENYATRGAYDEWWARKENDFTRFFARPRRHPGHDVDRLVRRLPARRHRVLRGDGRRRTRRRSG